MTDEDEIQPIGEASRAPLAMGTRDRDDGQGRVGFMRFADYDLEIDADQADEMSASLREMAIELRNGGRLS